MKKAKSAPIKKLKKSSASQKPITGGIAHIPSKFKTAKQLIWHPGGKDLVITKFGDAPASTTTSDGGGKKLRNVKVNLIFWGDVWKTTPAPNPSLQTVTNDCATILHSSFLNRVTQYGCNTAFLGGVFTTPAGDNPPTNYSMGNINDRVISAIHAGSLSEPDEEATDNLHVVFMPPGTNPPPNLGGEHTYAGFWDYNFPFDFDLGDRAHTAFVMFSSRASIASIFSHELVEALTDPEGDAIQVNPRNGSSWNEIGDICFSTGVVNGVTVQSYWSQQDKSCVIPVEKKLEMEITCIHKVPRNDAFHPIVKVGGINHTENVSFVLSQKECIRSIDRGNHFFVKNPGGGSVDVKVFIHFTPWNLMGTRYIATVEDNTKADNLLSLPECSG
ncbi:MAG: DUF3892 domain-containing protein [Ferruginibacter sp.]